MNNKQIKYSLTNSKLKLSNWEKFSHYSIVGFFFFTPLLFIFFHLIDYFKGTPKAFKTEEIWFLMIPSIIGLIFFFIQRNRLMFKEVNTSLKKTELNKLIEKVGNELGWIFIIKNSKIIVAKTNPNFFSGSWGEQITILFDNKRILVNSICDPNKKSSVTSMGRNKQNEEKLIKEIKKRV